MSEWVCSSCEYENESSAATCESCEEAAPVASTSSTSLLIVVAKVLSVEPVPNKDKLKVVQVDVGSGEPISIVTNAPNVTVAALVVAALPGARVRCGTEEVLVAVATVGGVKSFGILCDSVMLGWIGGGAGTAALVPDTLFKMGDAPPSTRPRMN